MRLALARAIEEPTTAAPPCLAPLLAWAGYREERAVQRSTLRFTAVTLFHCRSRVERRGGCGLGGRKLPRSLRAIAPRRLL